MTDHIYEANELFDFSQVIAKKPVSQSGGSFLIKFTKNDIPLYIQTPKCSIKPRSDIKPGKKQTYCDLVFLQENEGFIQWMENLEQYSQQTIFKNKAQWFETELELEDIENSFTSPMKSFKSGKSYIVRTNIPNILGKSTLKIYDEDENAIDLENISETMQVISIIEVQGIRCSARSFQIELEIKQMMILKPVNLFDKCILKPKTYNESATTSSSIPSPSISYPSIPAPFISSPSISSPSIPAPFIPSLSIPFIKNTDDSIDPIVDVKEDAEGDEQQIPLGQIPQDIPAVEEEDTIKIKTESQLDSMDQENPDILKEVEFDLETLGGEEDKVTLRQRNDVYYEMYKEARRKAKVARDLALSSYLEAKRIKNTYMLDDIIDSDDSEEEGNDEEEEENEENNEN